MKTCRTVLYLLTLTLVASLGAPAFAKGAVAQSELIRLRGDMQKKAERNIWKAVERSYQKMRKLRGVTMCWNDYYLASQAARGLNHIPNTLVRLWSTQAALERSAPSCKAQPNPQLKGDLENWIKDIQKHVARVKLRGKRKMTLEWVSRPFNPTWAAGADKAFERIKTKGRYTGLITAGEFKSSSGKTISVKPVNWSRVNACVTAENKKRKPRRARCIRKLKAQSFKL